MEKSSYKNYFTAPSQLWAVSPLDACHSLKTMLKTELAQEAGMPNTSQKRTCKKYPWIVCTQCDRSCYMLQWVTSCYLTVCITLCGRPSITTASTTADSHSVSGVDVSTLMEEFVLDNFVHEMYSVCIAWNTGRMKQFFFIMSYI